jgi:hypothetical protein
MNSSSPAGQDGAPEVAQALLIAEKLRAAITQSPDGNEGHYRIPRSDLAAFLAGIRHGGAQ